MSFKSREKKRARRAAIHTTKQRDSEKIAGRHYQTIVSHPACCNECGGSLRPGAECVYRNRPMEILCVPCADRRELKYRPSLRWEKTKRPKQVRRRGRTP